MSETKAEIPSGDSGGDAVFARQATGLVRSVSPLTSLIINFIPGNPVQGVGAGLLFALSLFAGGNIYVGILLVVPMMLGFSYAYGMLTAAIPRTGGDYTLVSRILWPWTGVLVAIFQAVAQFLSIAYFGIAFVTIGIAPGLQAFGVIDNHPKMISWGNTLTTSHGWQFGLGTVMILLTCLIMAGGWGWSSRVLVILTFVTLAGLGISMVVALFTSHSSFIGDFNSVMKPYTHSNNSYAGVLAQAQKGGVDLTPGFSFSNTIPLLGIMAIFAIYTYFSTYVGGELRQGRSMKTAHRMALAGTLNLAGVALAIVVFFHTFGQSFLTAAYGGGMPAAAPVSPFYFFLTGVILKSGVLALVIAISFALFWPQIGFIAFLQPVRTSFAFAFDGILPKGMTKVSGRTHAPYVAVAWTAVVSVATLAWAVYVASNFFIVIVYGTIMALVAMSLLGVAAIVFPYRRAELYRASVSQQRILGVPAVSIAGVAALASGITLMFLYWHYVALGLANKTLFFEWIGGTLAFAVIYYFAATAYRRSQGVDTSRAYAEIPPE